MFHVNVVKLLHLCQENDIRCEIRNGEIWFCLSDIQEHFDVAREKPRYVPFEFFKKIVLNSHSHLAMKFSKILDIDTFVLKMLTLKKQ